MMPVTEFLSCTEPLDDFESLSYHQTHHAKTYVTGLAAASSKTVDGIARAVLPANSERALNKFPTGYDWDVDQVNHERLEELQRHGQTRWSQDDYIIIDNSVNQKTGKELSGVGRFYDHSEGETVWGQNLVYAFYADDKTAYPLVFRQYEDDDDESKYEHRLPHRKIADRFDQLHELELSPASAWRATERAARAGRCEYEQIRAQIRDADAVHVDETGHKLDGGADSMKILLKSLPHEV